MIEYTRHIEEYSVYMHSSFSNLIPSRDWGDRSVAEIYLQKYWLAEQEYLEKWKPIQDKIFIEGTQLPDIIYHSGFEIIPFKGGCLFIEEDFRRLQTAMQTINEVNFVVIQHSQDFKVGEPMFRMKFPVNITWQELISGNYISAVLLEMSYNEYYIFAESGRWGRYSATDYDFPIDLIGFMHELAPVFQENFIRAKREQDEVSSILSDEYKRLII